MKAILKSVKPKILANVLDGKATLLIAKQFPKDYKGWVYIRCTKDKVDKETLKFMHKTYGCMKNCEPYGKVVARFYCDKVEKIDVRLGHPKIYVRACIDDLWCLDNGYHDKNYMVRVIHISQLEIFDKPKELREFKVYCEERFCHCFYGKCKNCSHLVYEDENLCNKKLTKALQNYCYVEVEECI